jgi:3-hydroxyacyl-[acyl-carrier-protein] dehydratase
MTAIEEHWLVPHDLPALDGHFPGRPLVPGVVLLDRVVWLARQHSGRAGGGWTVAQAKFLSPCGPGDQLLFSLQEKPGGSMAFKVSCAGRDVATGSLTLVEPA